VITGTIVCLVVGYLVSSIFPASQKAATSDVV